MGGDAAVPALEFSGAVRLADISDYISPAQACVVAAGTAIPAGAPAAAVAAAAAAAAAAAGGGGGVVPGTRAGVGKGNAPPTATATTLSAPTAVPPPPTDPVRVSLYDCLACSGCVTSAEAVLLESQGEAELAAALAASAAWRGGRGGGRPLVVSLTTQAASSLAGAAGVPAAVAAGRLAAALKQAGAAAVVDAGEARAAALVVAGAEFCARFAASPRGRAALALAGLPGAGEAAAAAAAALGLDPSTSTAPLPVLAGACPGWVCYAEKSAPAAVPHLAAARSPQALSAAAVKRALGSGGFGGRGAAPVFISIAPCADKKLEAVRREFRVEGDGHEGGGGGAAAPATTSPETDCALTTLEAQRWLEGVSFAPADDDALPPLDRLADLVCGRTSPEAPALFEAAGGGGSGGWAAFVFRTAAASLFGVSFPPGDAGLPWVAGRNAHARDLVLVHEPSGVTLLRVGIATGFRNIQTLVRRSLAKPPSASGLPPPNTPGPYDYVEVMACPGGCTNGGGQLRGVDAAGVAEAAVGRSAWEERARGVGEGLLAAVGPSLPPASLWAHYQARGAAGASGSDGGGGSSLAW